MGEPATRLRLRVSPGASESSVVGRYGEAWKVRVGAPADKNAANEELVRLVAERLDLPRRNVRLVAGHTARDKIVELTGISSAELERRMNGADGR